MNAHDIDSALSSNPASTLPLQVPTEQIFVRQRRLDPTSTAPGVARRWVTAELTAAGLVDAVHDDLYDILLCTSELINASLIADSTAMTLHLRVSDLTVVLSLLDDSTHTTNAFDEKMHAQLFGLCIFDSVALQWGIAAVPGGRVLWVELERAAVVSGRSEGSQDIVGAEPAGQALPEAPTATG